MSAGEALEQGDGSRYTNARYAAARNWTNRIWNSGTAPNATANYEYCQDHLYTHKHVTIEGETPQ